MNEHNEKSMPIVGSEEEARRLVNATGKAVRWEVKLEDSQTEQLIKKLMKRAKLKVIQT